MEPQRHVALFELAGQVRRRRGKTTISVQGVRTAPDLVERDFNPTTINLASDEDRQEHLVQQRERGRATLDEDRDAP